MGALRSALAFAHALHRTVRVGARRLHIVRTVGAGPVRIDVEVT